MRQLASGVTLVTTASDGRRAGLTATAVSSVTAEPPQLLVCVNRTAEAHPLITEAGLFAVNILSIEQRELAERFAGRDGAAGEARFDAGRWTRLVTGAPVLEDGLAAFDCRLVATLHVDTHTIFVGQVEAVCSASDRAPMVYHDGDYGLVARFGG